MSLEKLSQQSVKSIKKKVTFQDGNQSEQDTNLTFGGINVELNQRVFNLVSHYLFHHIIIFPPLHRLTGNLPCRAILRVKLKRH